jgi:hypothetical protein
MNRYTVLESGLAVPAEKPQPPVKPVRNIPVIELRDPADRALAIGALEDLWQAMDLSNPPASFTFPHDSQARYDAHKAAWELIARLTVGPDAPSFEVRT